MHLNFLDLLSDDQLKEFETIAHAQSKKYTNLLGHSYDIEDQIEKETKNRLKNRINTTLNNISNIN